MSLSISTIATPYQETYNNLLASILPGTQWLTAPTVVPFNSSYTPFSLTGNLGDIVEIYINNKLQTKITMDNVVKQVDLKLNLGANYIWVRSSTETFLALVAATYYAIYIDAWASDFYYYTKIRVDDASLQLSSLFSLRMVEHQIAFQDLLPPIKTLRLLTGKMSTRSLINETCSTRGVIDIATSISNSTPVVVPTRVNLEKFEPASYGLYTNSQDANGYEFDLWIPNLCVTSYVAFLTLINNLDDSIAKLVSVSDSKIVLDWCGVREEHIFNFETNRCSMFNNLVNEQDCFSALNIWISNILDEVDIAFCAYSYPLDIEIEIPLNSGTLDSGNTFEGTGILDSHDETDPYGTGFVGTVLTPPLDSGLLLDSGYAAVAFAELDCMYEPVVTMVGSALLETICYVVPTPFSSLIIDTTHPTIPFNDAVVTTDAILVGATYDKSSSDSISVVDDLAETLTFGICDSIACTDSALTEVSYLTILYNSISTIDNVSTERSFVRNNNDSVSVSDLVNTERSFVRNSSDSVTTTDSLTIEVTKEDNDNITITDSIGEETNYVRSSDDTLTAADLVGKETNFTRENNDSISCTDSYSKEIGIHNNDSVSIVDEVLKEVQIAINEVMHIDSVSIVYESYNNIEIIINEEESTTDSVSYTKTP